MEGGLSESKASQSAEAKLISAITSGAAYVDVEMEAPAMMAKRIRREARECGTTLIRSYHDFKGTDSENALVAIVEKCHHLGGEIVKIVTTATSKEDAQRVLSLYSRFPSESLIAFCMGDEGRDSRIGCLTCGAPFSYAAISEAEAAAPGQWPVEKMAQKVYAGRNLTGQECGSLTMPSSKSFAQRAIIFASLAQGTSHLSGYTPCGDNDSAIAVAKALGAKVVEDGDTLHITGTGCSAFRKGELHTGESGFLTRLMIPLLGVLAPSPVKVTGEKTLLSRPLKGARELMDAFGVTLESEGEEAMVPLTVKGALTPAKTTISGKGGSQIVSGLLSALPLLGQDSEAYLTEPKSIPYIFITLEVLKKFGIGISADMEGGEQFAESQDWAYCDAITFRIPGGQTYKAASFKIESDWSSAANFLVAGAIFGQADIEGLDTSSLQADLSIMDILTEAGASLSQDEESGVLHVQRAPLRAFDVDENNCPDLFPITAVLASMCQGTSRIQGVKRRLLQRKATAPEQSLTCSRRWGSRLPSRGYDDDRRALALPEAPCRKAA